MAARFPEVPRGQFETAVQLVETDGHVYGGAEAVFRALAQNPHEEWLLHWYEHSPVFARATEWGYRRVARNRGFFSALTRLAWGRHLDPPTHNLVRWVFLRSLGVIYLIAFVSLWVQIIGLVGRNGILPADSAMAAMRRAADAQHLGLDRYHLVPTLCWFNATDGFLKFQCAAGTTLAVLLIVGIAPAPCLFLLWLIYLSLSTVCRDFLGFQWDILLLETGFLAIFLAPLQLWPRLSRAAPPSRLVLWLLRWLLFKLMFQSGCVKLLSGDPAWRNLTALELPLRNPAAADVDRLVCAPVAGVGADGLGGRNVRHRAICPLPDLRAPPPAPVGLPGPGVLPDANLPHRQLLLLQPADHRALPAAAR